MPVKRTQRKTTKTPEEGKAPPASGRVQAKTRTSATSAYRAGQRAGEPAEKKTPTRRTKASKATKKR